MSPNSLILSSTLIAFIISSAIKVEASSRCQIQIQKVAEMTGPIRALGEMKQEDSTLRIVGGTSNGAFSLNFDTATKILTANQTSSGGVTPGISTPFISGDDFFALLGDVNTLLQAHSRSIDASFQSFSIKQNQLKSLKRESMPLPIASSYDQNADEVWIFFADGQFAKIPADFWRLDDKEYASSYAPVKATSLVQLSYRVVLEHLEKKSALSERDQAKAMEQLNDLRPSSAAFFSRGNNYVFYVIKPTTLTMQFDGDKMRSVQELALDKLPEFAFLWNLDPNTQPKIFKIPFNDGFLSSAHFSADGSKVYAISDTELIEISLESGTIRRKKIVNLSDQERSNTWHLPTQSASLKVGGEQTTIEARNHRSGDLIQMRSIKGRDGQLIHSTHGSKLPPDQRRITPPETLGTVTAITREDGTEVLLLMKTRGSIVLLDPESLEVIEETDELYTIGLDAQFSQISRLNSFPGMLVGSRSGEIFLLRVQ